MQNFSLHTHTVEFDGKDSVVSMIDRAAELKLSTIGISNHFIVYPGIEKTPMFAAAAERGYSQMYNSSFDEVLSKFIPHYAELRAIKSDVRVLGGMEVDFFDNDAWRDGFDAACKILHPDYKIGAAHFVEYGGRLCNSHDIKNASPRTQDKMVAKYWENVARAAASKMFNWMAHLDLIKKVGLGLDKKWESYENAALDAIAASNTAIEINTSGYGRVNEPYPSMRILRGAVARNIPVLLSDDAHSVGNIGNLFELGARVARVAGVKKFATLDQILKIR